MRVIGRKEVVIGVVVGGIRRVDSGYGSSYVWVMGDCSFEVSYRGCWL